MLITCQAGFEALLVRELAELHGTPAVEHGPGWVRIAAAGAESAVPAVPAAGAPPSAATPERLRMCSQLVFAHLTLVSPIEVRGDSVNGLAARIAEFFLASLRNERIEVAWPNIWQGPAELVGLGRRISGVEHALGELVKKKLSRVARLARAEVPRGVSAAPVRGLFVFFADFGRVFVAREAFVHGQQRMADDDLAPSRSYLKVEEAYAVLGREPQAGETVCDLGAAPGGWSYSAAKRGARVLAIDNGPLKGGALDHPQIEHRREDAFRFAPESGVVFDWLFCDLVEEPHHVLQHIVEPWLARGWCRRFVINLKFGRVDAIALLRELQAPGSAFSLHAPGTAMRHLYHDREELTLVGDVRQA
ncbi:SAM-dependent methyltransferase [Horticoccus sp. 23ND18S-11]|uniref:SAM-dependent methyltransferase n=1 Tax=Horticoccus sp. 23ND18S-11 TaxID=3391832 RepID=UPI0039C8E6D1